MYVTKQFLLPLTVLGVHMLPAKPTITEFLAMSCVYFLINLIFSAK